MLHNGQSGGTEERLHDVFVHARGRTQHARANVGDVGQFKQALNRAVLAEGSMQYREDHVHVDGAIGRTPGQRCLRLEWNHRPAGLLRLGWDNDCLATR